MYFIGKNTLYLQTILIAFAVKAFLLEKRSTIEWLCANEKCSFSATPEEWRREFAPGMYVWTDNSTATKINILHGMFEECNIPASELVFEFRSDQEGEEDE